MTEALVWELPRIFAGLLMFSLMFWVLALDWRSPVMRTFAAFMLLRGLLNVLLPFVEEGRERADQLGVFKAYSGYLEIGVPFIAVAFAVRLIDPERPHRRIMAALLAGAVVLEALYFWDHGLFWGSSGASGGVLSVMLGVGTLAYMVIGHVLMRRDDRAAYVAGVAYTLFPLFAATTDVGILLLKADGGTWSWDLRKGLLMAARFAVLAYGAWLVAGAIRSGPHRRAVAVTSAMVASAAMGLVPAWIAGDVNAEYWRIAGVFNGILTALMPVAIGWALTQRALFGTRGVVHLRMPHVVTLFMLIWATTLLSLYLGTRGMTQAAVSVGAFAVSMMVFLLVQSQSLGAGRQPSSAKPKV